MSHAVTAAEANRNFSRILGEVKRGASLTVTSHGRPVARIVPIAEDEGEREAARARLIEWLDSRKPIIIGPWTRDELYDC